MYIHVHVHHVDYVHLTSDYTCTCIILKCVIQVCNVHLASIIHVHVCMYVVHVQYNSGHDMMCVHIYHIDCVHVMKCVMYIIFLLYIHVCMYNRGDVCTYIYHVDRVHILKCVMYILLLLYMYV